MPRQNTNTKPKSSYAQAAASIKRELAQAFPGITFSVKSRSFSMGDAVDVRWSFGPTSREVDAIINKYAYGSFDGMDDSYNYDKNKGREAFRAAHGSAKYVHGSREIPHELFVRICQEIAALQGVEFVSTYQRRDGESLGLDDYAHQALARTSFPAGCEYVRVDWGLELTLTGSCASGDSIRIIHSMTDEEAEMRAVVKRQFDAIQARSTFAPQRTPLRIVREVATNA